MRLKKKERHEMPDINEMPEEIPEKPLPDGFGKGFAAGVLATLFTGAMFFAGWNAGQYMNDPADVAEQETENGAEILTDAETLQKLDEVKSLIEEYYLNDVDADMLSDYLFKGIAVGLDDVYANYYSEEELESVLYSSRGSYTGIGATLAQDGQSGTITVNDVYENTPASEARLQVGDELLAIDDTALTDVQLSDLVSMIKSEDGDFSITVYRPSDKKEVILPIMLGDVELQKVSYEMKQNGIGYIKIEEFTETAVDQFCEAVEALEAQNMQALIVDLRDNPGGLLTSVCDILD